MLSTTVKNIAASSANSAEEDRKSSENRSVSFDHSDSFHKESEADGTTTKANLKDDESMKNVIDFLADENSFRFETSMVSGFL
jgi:hypothetical protein